MEEDEYNDKIESLYDNLYEAESERDRFRDECNTLKVLVQEILESADKFDKETKPEVANLASYIRQYCKDHRLYL